jgi:hypothetical protein
MSSRRRISGDSKCLSASRYHHLLKTFCGWLDRQLPDGVLIWTSPSGQTDSTDPGSRLLFPALCKPTAPVSARTNLAGAHTNRGLMMPRRTTTRAHDRAKRIETERARNRAIRQNPETGCSETYSSSLPPPPADDDDPPPF